MTNLLKRLAELLECVAESIKSPFQETQGFGDKVTIAVVREGKEVERKET